MVEDKRILYKVATQFEVQPSVLIHIQKLIIAFVLVFVIILHANFCVLSSVRLVLHAPCEAVGEEFPCQN